MSEPLNDLRAPSPELGATRVNSRVRLAEPELPVRLRRVHLGLAGVTTSLAGGLILPRLIIAHELFILGGVVRADGWFHGPGLRPLHRVADTANGAGDSINYGKVGAA
jgi:hypothetical protein